MPSFISAAERALLKGCAEHGVGIEGLPGAPRFRFTPSERSGNAYEGREASKPSSRGSIPGHKAKGFPKLRNWSAPKLPLAPLYNAPMKGDDGALTEARRSWHNGNPAPLREYLADQAEARIQAKLFADG
jgi:hypothetical protein